MEFLPHGVRAPPLQEPRAGVAAAAQEGAGVQGAHLLLPQEGDAAAQEVNVIFSCLHLLPQAPPQAFVTTSG